MAEVTAVAVALLATVVVVAEEEATAAVANTAPAPTDSSHCSHRNQAAARVTAEASRMATLPVASVDRSTATRVASAMAAEPVAAAAVVASTWAQVAMQECWPSTVPLLWAVSVVVAVTEVHQLEDSAAVATVVHQVAEVGPSLA